jgi:hypothetical protein
MCERSLDVGLMITEFRISSFFARRESIKTNSQTELCVQKVWSRLWILVLGTKYGCLSLTGLQ